MKSGIRILWGAMTAAAMAALLIVLMYPCPECQECPTLETTNTAPEELDFSWVEDEVNELKLDVVEPECNIFELRQAACFLNVDEVGQYFMTVKVIDDNEVVTYYRLYVEPHP